MFDPPISRQPSCGTCGHEEHALFDCDWCLCAPHLPTGIYPEEPRCASSP